MSKQYWNKGGGFCYAVGKSDKPEAEACAPDFDMNVCAFLDITLTWV